MDNLLKATKILLKNDLVHNDIKPANCVWDSSS